MTKRIFRAILLVAAAILAACLFIIFGVLYDYFTGLSHGELRSQTALIAQAVENEGAAYFDGLDTGGSRITWIAADGTVLYDSRSDAAAMENHGDREEFIQAEATGLGESERASATLTERMLYCARRLSDGSVIRVSSTQNSVLSLVMGMVQPALAVLVLAVVLSAFLAFRLSRRITRPLNAIDLDKPLEGEAYEELTPLLRRIEQQHRRIEQQREELRRRREEWDAAAGALNEGIVLLGADNVILDMNKSARLLLGAGKDCAGAGFLTVCRRLELQTLLERAAAGEKAACVLEFDGRSYQAHVSPVLSDGRVKGAALLFFDVTDRLQAEKMRREFTANVSHELKTPLHTISGSAEIMKSGLVEPEDMPRFIGMIYDEAQRMIALVDDIIRLSGLDEGAGDLPREPLSLLAVARETAERLAPAAAKKNVHIDVSGDPGEIRGVPALISELVYNLCDNAVKYNKEGGSVAVTVAETPGEVRLTVSDTGIGIPPEDRERVFERFYRVDKSHSKAIGGTGLGLSIVKHAARLHNAAITLDSTPGQGTAITVSFPIEA